jgi:hypothetical protein
LKENKAQKRWTDSYKRSYCQRDVKNRQQEKEKEAKDED